MGAEAELLRVSTMASCAGIITIPRSIHICNTCSNIATVDKSINVAKSEHEHYNARPMNERRVVAIGELYAALDAKRQEKELSWREAAAQIGVSASTLTRMAQGAGPDIEGFGKIINWLEMSADDFIGTRRPTDAKASLPAVVSRHLRASHELNEKSAKALEGIVRAAYKHFRDLEKP